GLGEAAKRDVGTTVGTVAAGDDLRITGALQKENNLYELTNKSDARANLGLGTVATKNVGNSAGQIPDMSYWSSPSGGINFPNGLQMRFGTVADEGAKTFSTPFTNQCYGIVFGQTYKLNVWMFSPMYRAADLSKTGFHFANRSWSGDSVADAQDAGEYVFYIALGD
ncbi:phage tail protein, partial [Escherichia coli]|nr:phage tail protein [Escherichia coli]